MRMIHLAIASALVLLFAPARSVLADPSLLPRVYNKANVVWVEKGPLPVGVSSNCAGEAGGSSMTMNCPSTDNTNCYASIKTTDGAIDKWQKPCDGIAIFTDNGTTISTGTGATTWGS